MRSVKVGWIMELNSLYYFRVRGSKVIYGNGNEVFAKSNKVDVVDTIAAGDTFNAGFLLNLDEQDLLDRDSLNTINNDQLTQALSFANKVASITVTRKGANPPWHEELSNKKNNFFVYLKRKILNSI